MLRRELAMIPRLYTKLSTTLLSILVRGGGRHHHHLAETYREPKKSFQRQKQKGWKRKQVPRLGVLHSSENTTIIFTTPLASWWYKARKYNRMTVYMLPAPFFQIPYPNPYPRDPCPSLVPQLRLRMLAYLHVPLTLDLGVHSCQGRNIVSLLP